MKVDGSGTPGRNVPMTARIDRFSSPARDAGQVNVRIVGDDEEVIVIDPGRDAAGA
jgi:hypothetical protein